MTECRTCNSMLKQHVASVIFGSSRTGSFAISTNPVLCLADRFKTDRPRNATLSDSQFKLIPMYLTLGVGVAPLSHPCKQVLNSRWAGPLCSQTHYICSLGDGTQSQK